MSSDMCSKLYQLSVNKGVDLDAMRHVAEEFKDSQYDEKKVTEENLSSLVSDVSWPRELVIVS